MQFKRLDQEGKVVVPEWFKNDIKNRDKEIVLTEEQQEERKRLLEELKKFKEEFEGRTKNI